MLPISEVGSWFFPSPRPGGKKKGGVSKSRIAGRDSCSASLVHSEPLSRLFLQEVHSQNRVNTSKKSIWRRRSSSTCMFWVSTHTSLSQARRSYGHTTNKKNSRPRQTPHPRIHRRSLLPLFAAPFEQKTTKKNDRLSLTPSSQLRLGMLWKKKREAR